jgi:hypothetical protein
MFAGRIGLGQAAGEEAVGLLQSFEMQRGFGTLMEHEANVLCAAPIRRTDFDVKWIDLPREFSDLRINRVRIG